MRKMTYLFQAFYVNQKDQTSVNRQHVVHCCENRRFNFPMLLKTHALSRNIEHKRFREQKIFLIERI